VTGINSQKFLPKKKKKNPQQQPDVQTERVRLESILKIQSSIVAVYSKYAERLLPSKKRKNLKKVDSQKPKLNSGFIQ
jgi:hypothetical protein